MRNWSFPKKNFFIALRDKMINEYWNDIHFELISIVKGVY